MQSLGPSKAADNNVKQGDNILKAVTGKNAQLHIDAACEIGMGNKEYELITIEEKETSEDDEE